MIHSLSHRQPSLHGSACGCGAGAPTHSFNALDANVDMAPRVWVAGVVSRTGSSAAAHRAEVVDLAQFTDAATVATRGTSTHHEDPDVDAAFQVSADASWVCLCAQELFVGSRGSRHHGHSSPTQAEDRSWAAASVLGTPPRTPPPPVEGTSCAHGPPDALASTSSRRRTSRQVATLTSSLARLSSTTGVGAAAGRDVATLAEVGAGGRVRASPSVAPQHRRRAPRGGSYAASVLASDAASVLTRAGTCGEASSCRVSDDEEYARALQEAFDRQELEERQALGGTTMETHREGGGADSAALPPPIDVLDVLAASVYRDGLFYVVQEGAVRVGGALVPPGGRAAAPVAPPDTSDVDRDFLMALELDRLWNGSPAQMRGEGARGTVSATAADEAQGEARFVAYAVPPAPAPAMAWGGPSQNDDARARDRRTTGTGVDNVRDGDLRRSSPSTGGEASTPRPRPLPRLEPLGAQRRPSPLSFPISGSPSSRALPVGAGIRTAMTRHDVELPPWPLAPARLTGRGRRLRSVTLLLRPGLRRVLSRCAVRHPKH